MILSVEWVCFPEMLAINAGQTAQPGPALHHRLASTTGFIVPGSGNVMLPANNI